jgi:hypothetical protein
MTCVRTKQIDGPMADLPYAKRRDRGKGVVDERSIPPFHNVVNNPTCQVWLVAASAAQVRLLTVCAPASLLMQ